ncbi:MAG TPA: T9SS type A sorting domain-containing protein [Chryseolinea sp.]|nr:T9SS type A sorting domain-containing protein [Chryseolinea sp.]
MIDFILLSKRSSFFFLILLASLHLSAQEEVHRTENWITDSGITRVEHSNGYTMLSGSFSLTGPYTGGLALTDAATGKIVDLVLPKINGFVTDIIDDGSGGWYVGGFFSEVDTVKIQNLVHIKSDKTVDRTWKPNPNTTTSTLKLVGTTLYVAGSFTEIAGQTRNYIAALDVTTGVLTPWNPNANNRVLAVAVFGTTVYLGGYFNTIGGFTRGNLAAVDATTGLPTAWAPVVDDGVTSIQMDATSIFIAGVFDNAGGQPRRGSARLNLTTGLAMAWIANFDATGYANEFILSGNTMYMAGYFTTVNGAARNSIASVLVSSSVVTAWNPILPSGAYISDIGLLGSTIYMAGSIGTVNGQTRNSIAAVDAITATLLTWDPIPNSFIQAITPSTAGILIGGGQNGVNWISRNGFALLDDATDQPWPFDFDLNGGIVNTIAVNAGVLYIGGQFFAVNKTPRNNLAAFDLATGALLPWNPLVYGTTTLDRNVSVNNIRVKDGLLYVAGKFFAVNSMAAVRPGLAAVDLTTGIVNNWNPAVGDMKTTNEFVNSIDISGNTVYAAGSFSLLGGNQPRENIAAIDATTGAILPWNPVSKGIVDKIRVTSTTAYVVGEFANTVGGLVRLNRIAALNLSNNSATPWNPPLLNGSANDIAIGGSNLYVGGYFDSVAVQPKPGLASFSLTTGIVDSWTPDVGGNSDGTFGVNTISTSSTKLYIAGIFENLGTEGRRNYGEYNICPPAPLVTLDGTTLSTTATGLLQWYENNVAVSGATDQTYEINPLEYGVYAVAVTAIGCTARSADVVYLITAPELSINNELKVYPNPVQTDLFIHVPDKQGAIDLKVLDMAGRTVRSQQGVGVQHRLSLADLEAGIYLLIIQSQKEKHVRKIIKTR